MAFLTGVVLLLILDGWPVSAGQLAIDLARTYDILAFDVDARPTERGLEVDCRMRLVTGSPGPLRFLLSGAVEDLAVTRDDEPVAFEHGALGLEKPLDLAGVPRDRVPWLLTISPRAPPAQGTELTFRLRYRWRPTPGGWYRAGAADVETHLSGLWLPTMADEVFATRVRVRTDLPAFGPGAARRTEDGWLFESDAEQVVPLFVRSLARVEGESCEVFLPEAQRAEGEAIARDLADVLRVLERRFGRAGDAPFRLVVAPERGAPSYCGGSFAILKAMPRDRAHGIAHLAHECAHRWFGHRLRTPVIGRGGTWIREGLAEWAGIEVAGELLGAEAADRLWRGRFARYVSASDFREGDRFLFANEVTLLDATYVDDPVVPYLRGAMVFRLLAREEGFAKGLRGLIEGGPGGILDAKDVLAATGGVAMAAYYAGTTRLPDFRLDDVVFGGDSVRARILVDDPLWPGGRVPVKVETTGGEETVEVAVGTGGGELRWRGATSPLRIEVDPQRLFLDPVRSNSVRAR